MPESELPLNKALMLLVLDGKIFIASEIDSIPCDFCHKRAVAKTLSGKIIFESKTQTPKNKNKKNLNLGIITYTVEKFSRKSRKMSMSKKLSTTVSIIVPTFNEERIILQCLQSLLTQSEKNFEIIFIDDGSTDSTAEKIRNELKNKYSVRITLLEQNHKGPGEARNLGASFAKGKVLVFIDADMILEKHFVKNIIKPIQFKKVIGTDSQCGYLRNPENYWARCWNLGKFAAAGNYSSSYITDLIPDKNNYGNNFRAILKSDFDSAGGFETGGDYTDDISLAKRLGNKSVMANDAIYFHQNPDTLYEVWIRAQWIGRGKNFTQTTNKKIMNIFRFFPLIALFKGIIIGLRSNYLNFVPFKIIYDTAVWIAIIKTL